MKYIVVEFAGWAKAEPKNVKFVALKDGIPDCIDGETWMALDEDFRDENYILEDVIAMQSDAVDFIFFDELGIPTKRKKLTHLINWRLRRKLGIVSANQAPSSHPAESI